MSKSKKIVGCLFIMLALMMVAVGNQEVNANTYSTSYIWSENYDYNGRFEYSNVSLSQGERFKNEYDVYDEYDYYAGDDISYIDWYSSNNSIASVDNLGNVTAKSTGTATIYADIHLEDRWGYEDVLCLSYTVTVSGPSVKLNNGQNVSLNIGKTKALSVQRYGFSGGTTTFSSSNAKVVTVNGSGVVTAKSPGSAVITVTCKSNGATYTARCNVTVNRPYLSNTTLYLYKKGDYKLSVYGYTGSAVWKSSNKKVATVVNGKVKALKKGSATITCKVNGITLSCKVYVSNPSLSCKKCTITKGFTRKLNIYGKSGKGKWKVKNSSIVSVSKNGKIKAKKEGTTTVYCKTDGVTLKCKVSVKKNSVNFTPRYRGLEDVPYGEVKFSASKIYFDGNKLKVKGKLFNKSSYKYKKLPFIRFSLYINGDLTVTKEIYNTKINLKSFSKKSKTFTIAKSKYYRKHVNLRNSSVWLYHSIRTY